MLDIDSIPLDDQKTWDMICDGNVKGCFQIESHLGKVWCKKVQPRSIEELAAVISIIRPGMLKSYLDGKSMTQHFADRKNGEEEVPSLHPLIDDIIEPTQGTICYQEQAMQIAQKLAGFSLEDADILRKAAGKKDAKLMSEILEKFVDGCRQNNVDDVVAKAIAETINASNRYSFNKCLSPDTTVETREGAILNLDDVCRGQYIKTPNGFAEVVNKYDNGTKLLWNAKFANGKNITCTIDHKFQCEDGRILPLWEIMINGQNVLCDTVGGHSRLIDLTREGNYRCVDIEIDSDDHIFYGNGIATSNSHAVGYAMESYKSAYLKANYPLTFFCKWLENADEKIDPNREVKELVVAARNEDIEIFGPTLKVREKNFSIQKSAIYFGLLNVKYVGKKEFSKLECLPDTDSWIELLPHIAKINKRSIQALISVGALSFTGMSRSEMLHELKYYCGLTKKEQEWFEVNYQSDLNLADNLDRMLEKKKIQSRRKETLRGLIEGLKQPGRSLTDNPVSCVESEEDLLGISLHYSRLDGVDGASYSNATCKEMLDGRESGNVAVVLKEIKEHCTKNNDQMAFITCEDENTLDNVVIFPKQFEEYSDLLYEDNTLILALEKSKTQNSFIVNRVIQI